MNWKERRTSKTPMYAYLAITVPSVAVPADTEPRPDTIRVQAIHGAITTKD
jgi:hypothetical protein